MPPVRFLTREAGSIDMWASFSPDGKRVLFSRTTDLQKPWDLHVVSVSDGQVTRFLKKQLAVSATRAKWSRHDIVAFAGLNEKNESSIWLVKGDGTQARKVAATGVSEVVFYPSWYADGRAIAVVDVRELTIKRIDLDRGSAVAMTNRDRVLSGMPSVSPDGRRIAFAGQANEGQRYDQTKNVIWLVDETGNLQTLEQPAQQGRTPSWSADGEWLAFESNRGSSSPDLYAIFIVKRDGSGLRRMTSYAINANHPTWSPDAKQLVFAARHSDGELSIGVAIIDTQF